MIDSSEGISFSVPPSPYGAPGGPCLQTAAAGSLWQEPEEDGGGGQAACLAPLRAKPGTTGRSTSVVYVMNEASPGVQAIESAALQSLREACEGAAARLEMLPFGKLDFGETSVLDRFYNADISVVEMSDAFRQPSLFYHLGVRESFSRANNIILYCDNNSESLQSLKEIICQKNNRLQTSPPDLVRRKSVYKVGLSYLLIRTAKFADSKEEVTSCLRLFMEGLYLLLVD